MTDKLLCLEVDNQLILNNQIELSDTVREYNSKPFGLFFCPKKSL